VENVTKPVRAADRVLTRRSRSYLGAGAAIAAIGAFVFSGAGSPAKVQTGPTMLDANLGVRTVATGLVTPTTMAFIGPNDFLVLEKNPGRVRRVSNGVVLPDPVLDLAVNFGSERGMLGIALHPNFATNGYVYLYWTESAIGVDTSNLADLGSIWFSTAPLRQNRVDRFLWDGTRLILDRNLIRFRSYQAMPGQGLQGNHDGGVMTFGTDGKLYIIVGDVGRRGQMQNLPSGPTETGLGPRIPDDQFGGPEPDDAHLTGVIVRLNDDGTTPTDNPLFAAGAAIGGEVGANIQKIFVHGVRNSFGMTIDRRNGNLWTSENADDAFGEINRWEPGANGGWVQIMGPVSRIREFKAIETSPQFFGLQQLRWPPTRIADTPEEALSRLFLPPGSRYSDPEMSWRYDVSPTAMSFVDSAALGAEYEGDLFVGGAIAQPRGGALYRFELTANRQEFAFSRDQRLADRVADNNFKYDTTESESLLIGENFGAVTDIQNAPNGNLYVVSASRGAVYEIFRR
jgi:glucose/arabinose dehydrogenase